MNKDVHLHIAYRTRTVSEIAPVVISPMNEVVRCDALVNIEQMFPIEAYT